MHWLLIYIRPNRITNDLPVAGATLAVAVAPLRSPKIQPHKNIADNIENGPPCLKRAPARGAPVICMSMFI